MYPAMSRQLLRSKTLQSDTSFKRAKEWKELELGTWQAERSRGERP